MKKKQVDILSLFGGMWRLKESSNMKLQENPLYLC